MEGPLFEEVLSVSLNPCRPIARLSGVAGGVLQQRRCDRLDDDPRGTSNDDAVHDCGHDDTICGTDDIDNRTDNHDDHHRGDGAVFFDDYCHYHRAGGGHSAARCGGRVGIAL